MKPFLHALISVKKFGGVPADYIDIHNFIDSAKQNVPDERHRLILHNSFGVYICEQVFGEIITHKDGFKRMPYITLTGGKQISVRNIAEQHIIDDLGCIPTLEQCLDKVNFTEDFVGNAHRIMEVSRKHVTIID